MKYQVILLALFVPTFALAAEAILIVTPTIDGWSKKRESRSISYLSNVTFGLPEDRANIHISIHALYFGAAPTRATVVPSPAWLPGHEWEKVESIGDCYRSSLKEYSFREQYRYSGQARCRNTNYILIYNFFSKESFDISKKLWSEAFLDVVRSSGTRRPCLLPEELTFLADDEGPPFVTRETPTGDVEVAAKSMCGKDCLYFRFQNPGKCFHLVAAPH